MDSELSNSLETIGNLLYLIRKSLHNPAAVSTYVGLAQDRLRAIAFRYELGSLPETMLATPPCDPSAYIYETALTHGPDHLA
jgi:hypothetical protein